MLREMLKSKICRAVVTKTKLNYEGSIGIDKLLLMESDISPGEKVHVLNFNSGERFETYVIEEKEGSGTISLYGPAARLGQAGDEVYILSYAMVTDEEIGRIKPKIISLDKNNRLVKNPK
ncbi:aspartate 1-decarboxylase [bacterium]|nr:aspartate 1-decarboxylase [bacterium]